MATVSNTDSDNNTANQTAYTFTAVAIGTDGGSDILYVVPAGRSIAGATAISSVTINSVAASSIVQRSADEGGGVTCVIGLFALARSALADPSVTTVTVVVTFSAAMIRAAMDTYVGAGSVATAHATATDGTDSCTEGADTMNLNLNVPGGGIVIGASTTGSPSDAYTWADLTEQTEFTFENSTYSSAMLSNGSAETPRTITADMTLACAPVGVAASFAPAASLTRPWDRKMPFVFQ